MKPHIHAINSSNNFGGKPGDYIAIHRWFDATKEAFPDNRHRALRHHTFGIFDAERVFGVTIKNSDGKEVSVRDIGEQHVMEDLGFIPTVADYLNHMVYRDWMGHKGPPPNAPSDNTLPLKPQPPAPLETVPFIPAKKPSVWPFIDPWQDRIID